MKLANSLYEGSNKMYVPVRVRDLGAGIVRLQIPGGHQHSWGSEYDLVNEGLARNVLEREANYKDRDALVESLYPGSNKRYVPAQLRVISGTKLRLQFADVNTGKLDVEYSWQSKANGLSEELSGFKDETPDEVLPQVALEAPTCQEPVTTSVVAALATTLEEIKASIDDLVNEQVRMVAITEALADRIHNL